MELKLPECLQTFKKVAAPASCPETPESLNSVCFIAKSVNDGPLEEQLPPRQLLTDNQLKALLDEDRRLVRMDQQIYKPWRRAASDVAMPINESARGSLLTL